MGVEKYVVAYGMSRTDFRQLLYDRQDGLCGICTEELPRRWMHSRYVNTDHTRPLSHGGPDDLSNVTLCHLDCNLSKGQLCAGCEACLQELSAGDEAEADAPSGTPLRDMPPGGSEAPEGRRPRNTRPAGLRPRRR